jgi:heme o synthase
VSADATLSLVAAQRTSSLRDYLSLVKPRIIALLVLTEVSTMVMAARGVPPVSLLLWAALGGALAAGGAGAINCWYDRDIDREMARTCGRPLPSGRIRPWQALGFGVALTAASVAVFSLEINRLAALLALAGGAFYVFVYTMVLKRSTPLNIVIGGAAGAVPPLVAWASVRGEVEWPAFALFAIVFVWTPPHFWSLALLLRDEYRRAGVPMLPLFIGTRRTHLRILVYVLVLVPVSLLPGLILGPGYAIPVAVIGSGYIALAVWARRATSAHSAELLFHYSLLYLALVFVIGALAAGW